MKTKEPGRHADSPRAPARGPRRSSAGFVRRRLSGAIAAGWSGVTTVVGRVPGTLGATRTGAHDAASALQALPDPTLRWLAAGSVGLSAGLFLTGKPRLIIAAGIAPALAMGAAIVARSAQPVIPGVVNPVRAVEPRADAPRRIGLDLTRRGRSAKRG